MLTSSFEVVDERCNDLLPDLVEDQLLASVAFSTRGHRLANAVTLLGCLFLHLGALPLRTAHLLFHGLAPQLPELALQLPGLFGRQLLQGALHVERRLLDRQDAQLEHDRVDEGSVDFSQVFPRFCRHRPLRTRLLSAPTSSTSSGTPP